MTSLDWYGWPVLAIAHGFRRGSMSVYADSGQDARGERQEQVMLLETDGTGQEVSTHDNFDPGRAASLGPPDFSTCPPARQIATFARDPDYLKPTSLTSSARATLMFLVGL